MLEYNKDHGADDFVGMSHKDKSNTYHASRNAMLLLLLPLFDQLQKKHIFKCLGTVKKAKIVIKLCSFVLFANYETNKDYF